MVWEGRPVESGNDIWRLDLARRAQRADGLFRAL